MRRSVRMRAAHHASVIEPKTTHRLKQTTLSYCAALACGSVRPSIPSCKREEESVCQVGRMQASSSWAKCEGQRGCLLSQGAPRCFGDARDHAMRVQYRLDHG